MQVRSFTTLLLCLFTSCAFCEEEEASVFPDLGELDFFSIMPAAPKALEVKNSGNIEFNAEENLLVYNEEVVIKSDTGLQIFAESAEIDLTKEVVTAKGGVSIYNGPILYRGDEATYFYSEKRLDTVDLKTSYDPFLLKAKRLRNIVRDGVPVLVADEASITTDDYANPSYWIRADRVSIYPNELAVFQDMRLEVGGRTLLKLPYMAQSLNQDLGYHFTIGGQTNLGAYWKNRYGMYLGGERDEETGRVLDPDYLMQLHLDPYSRRGVGMGVDLEKMDYIGDPELGFYSVYWIYDLDPQIERSRESRGGFDQHNRYKIEVKDRRTFDWFGEWNTRFDTNITLLSDEYFLEDFYEERVSVDPQPDNVLSLSASKGYHLFNASTRFQLNSFYETDERLPEVSYDRVRAPFLDSAVLYESQSRVGFLRESLAEEERRELTNELVTATPTRSEEIRSFIDEDAYLRAHTWHELSLPLQMANGLSITPRAGVGYTHYNAEGRSSTGRALSYLGVDFSLKMSRNFLNVRNETLGLDGVSHILKPYANLSLLDVGQLDYSPSAVDGVTPLTRPSPINVGRYSAIDALDDWSILRAGLRQNFLTRRDGKNHQWLYWDTYFDFLLGEEDSTNSFSNLYNEIRWEPLPWLKFDLETQFPVSDSANDFSEIYFNTDFMLGRSTSLEVGYSYLDNHPILEEDSNQFRYQIYHRFSEEWGVGLEHRWQFDDSTLELQRYALHRNMQSWILSTEFYVRDFRVEQEWGFSFGFTLRDFPDISLPVALRR